MTERTRHRKSRSTSEIEEISHFQQQKSAPKLSSDSRSHITGSNRDYMIIPKLGQSSLGQATGTSIKKLLAEEMSKETESKRRSPNVIAKLMGLDGQPSPQHVLRQQRPLSDSYELKIASKNKQRHRKQHDCRSSKKSAMEQEEIRDVYEDVEASHIVNRRCSSRWSPDATLEDSKELDDTLDMLDSNKELLLKYLQKRSPVFEKHLRDAHVDHLNSFGSHIAVLKPSYSAKYEGNAKAWKSESDSSSNLVTNCHLKREDGLLLAPYNWHGAYISPSSPEIELQEKNGTMILPTRIVVLKPNLGKMQNAGISSSSQSSHGYLPNFSKTKECSSVGGAKTLSWRSKDALCNEELPPKVPTLKGAREIARDITRRMRVSCDETMDPKSSGFRGYAGDESSYDAYGSDSDSESDKFKLFHRSSSCDKKWCSYPSPNLSESSVNKEAKKRLSERWKVTHRYQDVEIVGKGSTLGEMLAKSDRETWSKHSNAAVSISREGNLFGNNNGTAMWDNPVGISSRDGWKNMVDGTSCRDRSISPCIGGRSYKSSTCHDKLAGGKHLMDGETLRHGRGKVVKEDLSRTERISSKDSKLLSKKHFLRRNLFTSGINASADASFEIQMEANIKVSSAQQPTFQIKGEDEIFQSIASDATSSRGGTTSSSKSSESLPKQSFSVVDKDPSLAHDQDDSTLQKLHKGRPELGSPSSHFLGTEPDSSESSKEADHPSPVSVLQAAFAEDTSSSSKNFERVRAELHELRMQLQLLKMESGEYSEVSLTPLEEEVSELSPIVSGRSHVLETEGWEVSYALDVLNNYGIEEPDPDTSTNTLSTECPLDPGLFDDLEKKYGDITVGSRPERRLLFDMINSSISQVSQQKYDLFPWVQPKLGISQITRQKDEIRDDVVKLINRGLRSWEVSERVLDREMQWPDPKREVNLVGSEIEKLLIDDLISDVICIY